MIRRWKCKCDCGNITIVRHGDLRNGSTVSCGCYNHEKESAVKTHGYSRTKLGNVFEGMKQRCNNPKNKNYEKYGGRGIEICTEWLNDPKKFFDWAIKNGYCSNIFINNFVGIAKNHNNNNDNIIACLYSTSGTGLSISNSLFTGFGKCASINSDETVFNNCFFVRNKFRFLNIMFTFPYPFRIYKTVQYHIVP